MTLTDEQMEQLNEVEQTCFHGSWTREMLTEEIENPMSVLVTAERDGRIVGFALGRVVLDEGELYQIGVLPELRRARVASGLLEEFHAQIKAGGAACCFLEVRSRNEAARALYESAGYERISVRRGYYDDDDAVIYRREMNKA